MTLTAEIVARNAFLKSAATLLSESAKMAESITISPELHALATERFNELMLYLDQAKGFINYAMDKHKTFVLGLTKGSK